MILVSNTGPLIALAKIGKISLLQHLNYESVCVPPIVHKELWGKTGYEAKAIEAAFDSFIKVITPKPLQAYVEIAISELDDGEKQVISLGLSVLDSLLLIDDKAGRHAAKNLGLSVIGTAGILIEAKLYGLVDKVMPLINEIRQKGYYMSDSLIEQVRRSADE